MAIFHTFQIQLLPLDTKKTKDVGTEGYKKLFEELNKAFVNASKKKTLLTIAHQLDKNNYFAPYTVHTREKYTYGTFFKFVKADTLLDLYTGEELYKAEKGSTPVAHRVIFDFIFDHEKHKLKIHTNPASGRLPSTKRTIAALQSLILPIAQEKFPDHTLTVNVISDKIALDSALSDSKGFFNASAEVHFPNGPEADELLEELRDKGAHNVKASASAARGATMNKLPEFIMNLIKISATHGKSTISYLSKKYQKRIHFNTEDVPDSTVVRAKKTEDHENYLLLALKK